MIQFRAMRIRPYWELLSSSLSPLSGFRTGLLRQMETGLGMGSEENELTDLGTIFLLKFLNTLGEDNQA